MTSDPERRDSRPVRRHPPSRRPLVLIGGLLIGFGIAYALLTRQAATPQQPWPDSVAEAVDAGELETAREILRKVRRENPEDYDALVMLAIVESMAGEYERALSLLDEHPAREDDPALTLYAARFSLNLNDLDLSLTNLERTLKLQPNHLEARRLLANLEVNLMRPNRARVHLAVLDANGAAGAQDVCQFCAGDRSRFDLDENVKHLEEMRRRDTSNPLIIYALADNYWRMNRGAEARALLASVDWRNLAHKDAWRIPLGLAELAVDEQHYTEALQLLEQLPEPANESYRVWLARGRCYRALDGQPARALVAFRNAAMLDPYNPEPVFVISQLIADDDAADAARLRERATQLQSLNVLVESALRLESLEAAAERILSIGEKFVELGFDREAVICFRWLDEQGYSFEQIPRYLSELEGRTRTQTLASRLPDPAALRALPSVETADTHLRPVAGHDIPWRGFREVPSAIPFEYDCSSDRDKTLLTSLGGGVAVLDFDRDDVSDLFFPQGGPLPNASDRTNDIDEFFRGSPDRGFKLATTAARIRASDYGHGVDSADFDNDGFPDLFVANYGRNSLYRNNGDGTFDEVTAPAGIDADDWSVSAAFADFDNDGNCDLYVVNYLDVKVDDMVPCTDEKETPCGPLRLPSQQDRLWLNGGSGVFGDVTEVAGIVVPHGKGLGVIAAHLNDDDRIDLFVSNDTTANLLFLNEPRDISGDGAEPAFHFRESAQRMGVAVGGDGTAEACMGIACGDVDADQRIDLFVTNFQAETNTLYLNLGGGLFTDRTEAYRLGNPSYSQMGWGTQFLDVEGDGDLDLFVANGHLHQGRMRPQLFLMEDGQYRESTAEAGAYFGSEQMGRGAAVLDVNHDLAPDLLVTHREGAPTLLENQGPSGNRLELQLVGVQSNRDGIGARILVQTGEQVRLHQMLGGGGYVTSRQTSVLIGVGAAQNIDKLTVIWPSGLRQEWTNVLTGRRMLITEGRTAVTLPVNRPAR